LTLVSTDPEILPDFEEILVDSGTAPSTSSQVAKEVSPPASTTSGQDSSLTTNQDSSKQSQVSELLPAPSSQVKNLTIKKKRSHWRPNRGIQKHLSSGQSPSTSSASSSSSTPVSSENQVKKAFHRSYRKTKAINQRIENPVNLTFQDRKHFADLALRSKAATENLVKSLLFDSRN
jgi:hypothetical protein